LDEFGQKIVEITQNKTKEFHCFLDPENINSNLLEYLQSLEPYGSGNPKLKFIVRNLRKLNSKIVGEKHISCIFSSLSNVGFFSNISGIAFRAVDTAIASILLDQNLSKPISVVCEININNWMGVEKPQLVIEDCINS
jgi:single-stranded-DNA-specific exonuclease